MEAQLPYCWKGAEGIQMSIAAFLDSLMMPVVMGLEGGIGSRVRYAYYRQKLRSCRGYFTSGSRFRMEGCDKIEIGEHCSFNGGVFIGASSGVRLGDYVMIGPYCVLRDANHGYADRSVPMKLQKNVSSPIEVCDDVWIGAHVVILKGVKINKGAVVAACSLVNKDIPSYEVWGGVPARFLRLR